MIENKTNNQNITDFEEIKFFDIPDYNGVQAIVKFDNGYGASIVRHMFSYGGPSGLFEMAVIDENNEITYNTSITNDVIGHLTESQVSEYLVKIKNL